jgi:ABC-type phosphate/phosphonate transport system ATPase subunit
MMDARSWAIGQLVAKIGHRFSGKETLIPTTQVDRISYEESTVFLNLTEKASEQGSAPQMAAAGSTH